MNALESESESEPGGSMISQIEGLQLSLLPHLIPGKLGIFNVWWDLGITSARGGQYDTLHCVSMKIHKISFKWALLSDVT
eukprot:12472278-Ditylum_brightwellii.AAC.1